MNYKHILHIMGRIVLVEGVFMLPALIISGVLGERRSIVGFLLTLAIILVVGLPCALLKTGGRSLVARDGFIAVGIAWIAVSAFGALPFFFSGAVPNYIDCLFETVSGFTTTGASILPEVESLPKGVIYWRSFTHWLGGMGVLVFVLMLSPLTQKDSGESMHLLRAESPGIRITKLVPRMRMSATILYTIYIILTVVEMIFLLLGSMPVFDAVTISFGTAGTGGFGVRNDSAASYTPYCQWVITVFMLVFSVNFNMYYLLLLRQVKQVLRNEELRLFFIIVLLSILAISWNISPLYAGLEETVRAAAFQVASIISTSGFGTVDFDQWPELSRMILVLLMFVGACAGSTGGGIKVVRLIVMYKAARRSVYKVLHPNSISLIHMDGEVLDEDTVNSVNTYLSVYMLLFALCCLLVALDGQSFETTFTAVAACINNIGPGLGAVGPTMNYGGLSLFSKVVLTISMLIGRLEIYPILALVGGRARR